MTNDFHPLELTDQQQGEICGVLSVGCDRQTAVDIVGCSLRRLRSAMQSDAAFAARVRRAEASAELTHMRNVQELAQAKKDWKASVWWLERRAPERFARRAGSVTPRQLKAFIAVVSETLQEAIASAEDRGRVAERLRELADEVDSLLSNEPPSAASDGQVGKPLALVDQRGESTYDFLSECEDPVIDEE